MIQEWIIYRPLVILFFFFGSLIVYAITKHPDLKTSKVNGRLLGSAVALMSWFEVGALCIVTLALYLYASHLLEKQIHQRNQKV